ncbi:MAG: hypothetical protein AAGF11_46540 [Myxococcota bacterium]
MPNKHTSSALRLASMTLLSSWAAGWGAGCGAAEGEESTSTLSGATLTSGPTGGPTSLSATSGPSSTGASSATATPPSTGADGTATSADDSTGKGTVFDVGGPQDIGEIAEPVDPVLWYSVADRLIYIELDPADGSVAQLVEHQFSNEPAIVSQGAGITMLEDGGLLIARGPQSDGNGTYVDAPSLIYYAASPPTTIAGDVEFELLGPMPDNVAVEGLHVDCQGLVYLMDSGTNSASADGNRLLRFTGDFLAGDLSYEVITDLSMASVADIDDMSPGINAMGEITDSQGFAIDSGTVHDFDYVAGTGVVLGMAGTYGIHALGGALFEDATARLYVMNIDAELFLVDPVTLASSSVLVTGPDVPSLPFNGNSGLAGPLTACETGFPPG